MSNAGALTWRPQVTLAFFEDVACTEPIAIPADGGWPEAALDCDPGAGCALCSGWDSNYGTVDEKGCHLAFADTGDTGDTWRPGDPSTGGGNYYPAGDVWMEIRFASDPGIACVKASNLGEHADGGTWNGGLTVQTSVDGGVTYITRERDEGAAPPFHECGRKLFSWCTCKE